jgi:HAD superfamily hydrolase (TIGR01549 family)
MIKAVIFDIDGVLLDSFEANFKFFQDLMIKAGYQPPTREKMREIFHFSLLAAIKELSQSTDEEEIARINKMGASRNVSYDLSLLKMPAGAGEVIKKLHDQYPLGIVTSRIRTSVYEFPKLAGLKKYFSVVVSYEDTARHKPYPDPLLLAAEKLDAAPKDCVYIGDVANDIAAARAAGMKIIIYSAKEFIEADAFTPSFKELSGLIASL